MSAILLAAGAGSRFGGGKLTTIFDEKPLVSHPLEALCEAPVDETVVVVGAEHERLREVCKPYVVRILENPDWEEGQSTSVRAGLQAMSSDVRAVVVLLGDQPLVTATAISKLIEVFEAGAEVAVATYEGWRRNPVLFARPLWPTLMDELSGDEGARSFMRQHPELVVEVPCDGVASPADVDTEEDLRRVERMRGLA